MRQDKKNREYINKELSTEDLLRLCDPSFRRMILRKRLKGGVSDDG
jgi:hypothetical protein